ncbi:MAG TPA: endonuclease MutS2 [Nitrospira sp.]|nr:endonuclease MutS2 [Nitrospira sp.]HNK48728.1 endonuclease MutS2 [Nitrospira sp.]
MQSEKLQFEACKVLEWAKLLDLLAGYAQSEVGAEQCRSMELERDVAQARLRQEETSDMLRLRASVDPFPVLRFPDVTEWLKRVVKGACLEAHELRDIALVLELVVDVQRYLLRHQPDAPTVGAMAEQLGPVTEYRRLTVALNGAIDPDGSIRESASPELHRLIQRANDFKQQMRHRLEQILHSRRYEEVLQERYFAQREGRYVVPIKAEMQGRMPGIVHDVSSSGATLFLEPRELVDLNNSIKVVDLDIEREVRRILRELSALVAPHQPALAGSVTLLGRLDAISAKAGLSQRLQGSPPRLNDQGRILLTQARHPFLVVSKDQVVSNDLAFDETVRVLIISGPNTGGKTVILKLLGLFSLMVRCGLHLPCAPESEMAIFPSVYADIGDAQDLARDLSSFSAHITQMVQLLNEVSDGAGSEHDREPVPPGRALVLLDEPVTSTDPAEGAALASALLCRLAAAGVKVVATTHYSLLKGLAQDRPGFANASVEFNLDTLSPTYRLIQGQPGGSAAIEIAGRLGMDQSLLEDARARLQGDNRLLETLLSDLQDKQRRLNDDLVAATAARQGAEQASREAQELLTFLQESERDERQGLKKKLSQEFQRARAAVQATMDDLKRDQKLLKAKEAKARLVELEESVRREAGDSEEPIPIDQLTIGDAVEVIGLGMTGTLLENPQGKKRVRLKVGEGEILANVASLAGVSKARQPQAPAAVKTSVVSPRRTSQTLAPEDIQETLDVRGQAADDALDVVVAGLDRAILGGSPFVRIIHGHGTGRLRSALRDYLKDSPYVVAFRGGDRAEGGDGVTIVQLR